MSIIYGTSKSKKCYNNSTIRKKQTQQQILNSLKSWNVKIEPSGLDKPEIDLPASIVHESSIYLLSRVPSQNKSASIGRSRENKSLVRRDGLNIEQENRCPDTEIIESTTKKKLSQEIKHYKPKQKGCWETRSSNYALGAENPNDKKGLDSSNHYVAEAVTFESDNPCQADAHFGVESPPQCTAEVVVGSVTHNFTSKVVAQSSDTPALSFVSRANYPKNNNSKTRGAANTCGWNHRVSNYGLSKEYTESSVASVGGKVMEKSKNIIDGMLSQGNYKVRKSFSRLEHYAVNTRSSSIPEALTIHPNQQHLRGYTSYVHQSERQHHEYMGYSSATQQSSNGSVHQHSLGYLCDIGQKLPIVEGGTSSSAVNTMFSATSQTNYNFAAQLQQQRMQHYHNTGQLLHLPDHSTRQESNQQLLHMIQQKPAQPYIHDSKSEFTDEDVPNVAIAQRGGGECGGGPSGPVYDTKGTAGTRITINTHQEGMHNHQPMYHNNHQQHQFLMNSYQQNNNYRHQNRNVTSIRCNQLNHVVQNGLGANRENAGKNGKKTSWTGNACRGKTGLTDHNVKHFTKMQNNGYGYRKNYQHCHNHPVGGGHSQNYDYLNVPHQQQQPMPQQHYKQQQLHRNLVYVRGYDRGTALPQECGEEAIQELQHEAGFQSAICSASPSPLSKTPSSVPEFAALDQACEHDLVVDGILEIDSEIVQKGRDDVAETRKQDKSSLSEKNELELKEFGHGLPTSSSSSLVSITSTESSAISSIISQTQLLDCTSASVHEYDSDSSHSSDLHDAANRFSKYEQLRCGQVYRSSSSTSGISSSATNPHSNEFIPSIPSSLHASSAKLSDFIHRSHSYHGSHQNLTAYGSTKSFGAASSPIGSPTEALRPISVTQSVPIFGELFANSSLDYHQRTTQFTTGSHSSTVSFGSTSSLEMALRSSSSSLPASSVPPNDSESMQSGHPKKRSLSGQISPAISHDQCRPASSCLIGHNKGPGAMYASNSRKNHQVSSSFVHRSLLPTDFQYTPADRFILRANDVELKIPPDRLSTGSPWDELSEAIWSKFCSSQQTANKYLQKMQLWRDLYICIKQGFPKYGLYLVGSTISGFGADNSDVDMCLVSRTGTGYFDPRNEALQNLMLVKNYFMSMTASSFEQFCLIQAKVPILRFQDKKNGIEVDLNYNNCVGIRNTHLLHCYSQMDWRVRPLVLVVKLWAQHHNINDAKSMTISSYSLVLMVIHFLQYGVKPSILPCLHSLYPNKFMKINDINNIEMIERVEIFQTENKETLGELLLHFLEYYKEFDYAHNAISVRTASIIPIEECRLAKSFRNDVHQWKHLCIEEPFDLTNTARSVFDSEVFEQIKCTIAVSWRMLKDTKDLKVLFGEPLFTPVAATLSMTS